LLIRSISMGMVGLVIGVHSVAHASGDLVGDLVDDRVSDHVRDQVGAHRVVFENGFELIVIEDESAADEPVQMWLIVRAGSMYERDEERGAAMVLEQLVRRGTAHFDAGAIDEILIDRPNEESRASGSFVGFDQAGYLAEVDTHNREQMKRVLAFFGDVGGLDLDLVLDEDIEQ